jgi:hypothetical protein
MRCLELLTCDFLLLTPVVTISDVWSNYCSTVRNDFSLRSVLYSLVTSQQHRRLQLTSLGLAAFHLISAAALPCTERPLQLGFTVRWSENWNIWKLTTCFFHRHVTCRDVCRIYTDDLNFPLQTELKEPVRQVTRRDATWTHSAPAAVLSELFFPC